MTLIWRHNFTMSAVTSFHTEKWCRLVIARTQRLRAAYATASASSWSIVHSYLFIETRRERLQSYGDDDVNIILIYDPTPENCHKNRTIRHIRQSGAKMASYVRPGLLYGPCWCVVWSCDGVGVARLSRAAPVTRAVEAGSAGYDHRRAFAVLKTLIPASRLGLRASVETRAMSSVSKTRIAWYILTYPLSTS